MCSRFRSLRVLLIVCSSASHLLHHFSTVHSGHLLSSTEGTHYARYFNSARGTLLQTCGGSHHSQAPQWYLTPIAFPSSEVDHHLGTSVVCQSVTRKTRAVARVRNREVSGAQVTKNSSRLELGMLQMVGPVPKLPSCAESSAATMKIIWFCCRWWPVQSFQSLCVTQEWHLVNSCSGGFLVHFWSLGMVEGEHPVVPKYCWGADNTPSFILIETRSVQLQLSKFQPHFYSVSSTIPTVTAWKGNVQHC